MNTMKLKVKNIVGYGLRFSLLVMVSMILFACSAAEESDTTGQEPASVTVREAALTEGSTVHRFSGTVASEHTVRVSTKVTGEVTHLDVQEGDYVEKDEVLLRIKDDNLQAQKNQVEANLEQAQAALTNTETNYRRIKNLFEQESATQKEMDDITTQYESAKANVRALEAKLLEISDLLDYTVLEAPFSGYVVEKRISEGDLAGPGQPLLILEQEGAMKVNLSIPESQVGLFQLNEQVRVDVPAAGASGLQGVIASINPAGKRGSRQFGAEIVFSKPESASGLKSGMYAEVSLATQGDGIVTVPESALIHRGQLAGVYTLNDQSEVILRWIRLGKSNVSEGTVEVLSGLAPGEKFVASFDAPLQEGQKVTAQ